MRNVVSKEQLSQLADGELPADEACTVLLETLDDPEARSQLESMLQLRRSLQSWRSLMPRTTAPSVPRPDQPRRLRSRVTSLLAYCGAAMVGGVLVVAGLTLIRSGSEHTGAVQKPMDKQPPQSVTPQQQREVAQVFQFHQSVAGPLRWYAADDDNILLSSAGKSESTGRPVAVLMRFRRDDPGEKQGTKECVFVCRENEAMSIRLPTESADTALRVYLIARPRDGTVHVEYALALEGAQRKGHVAAVVGRRNIALSGTPLGQLAAGEQLIDVQANAWVMEQDQL